MEKFKFIIREKIHRLPKKSGVYCFKAERQFLYIGKATNIRERVKNHIQQPSFRDNLFIKKASKIGYLKTDSEIEALILEANLIKKYQPKYNIFWRDDKNYFFVAITREDFPRIFITHQPELKRVSSKLQAKYIGPFVDGKALKQTLKILRKVFPYRACKNLPKRPCLWYQLSRCPAPCLLKSKLAKQLPLSYLKMRREYRNNIRNIAKILLGRGKQLFQDLEKEMKESSRTQDFERAAKIRDQIRSLNRVFSHAKIFEETMIPVSEKSEQSWSDTQKILQDLLRTKRQISRIEAYDVSNIQGKEAAGSMVVFINGKSNKDLYRRFKIKIEGKPNDVAMIKEILNRRFQHSEWGWPNLILIDGGISQLNVAKKSRNKMKKGKLIPLMALAKKENKLYIENHKQPISLKALPREIFNLILQLRDEAHRFAITYHRKLRRKRLIVDR
jgi:excinuclease ABC subunit C